MGHSPVHTNSRGQLPLGKLLLDGLKGRDDRLCVRRVGADANGLATGRFDLGHDVVVALWFSGEEDYGVGLGEAKGDGAACAAAYAGDDCVEFGGWHFGGCLVVCLCLWKMKFV